MKAVEFRKQSEGELGRLLDERLLRAEELRLTLRQKKAKNVKELSGVRKDIARIHTILRERQLWVPLEIERPI